MAFRLAAVRLLGWAFLGAGISASGVLRTPHSIAPTRQLALKRVRLLLGDLSVVIAPSNKRTRFSASCLAGAVRLPAEAVRRMTYVLPHMFFQQLEKSCNFLGDEAAAESAHTMVDYALVGSVLRRLCRSVTLCVVDSSMPKLRLALWFFVVGLSGPPVNLKFTEA